MNPRFLLVLVCLAALSFGRRTESDPDPESVMRMVVVNIVGDGEAERVFEQRQIVFSPILYPEADSIPVPRAVIQMLSVHGDSPIVTREQLENRDPSIAILTIHKPSKDDDGSHRQEVEFVYFDSQGTAFSKGGTMTARCKRRGWKGRICESTSYKAPFLRDYGPRSNQP